MEGGRRASRIWAALFAALPIVDVGVSEAAGTGCLAVERLGSWVRCMGTQRRLREVETSRAMQHARMYADREELRACGWQTRRDLFLPRSFLPPSAPFADARCDRGIGEQRTANGRLVARPGQRQRPSIDALSIAPGSLSLSLSLCIYPSIRRFPLVDRLSGSRSFVCAPSRGVGCTCTQACAEHLGATAENADRSACPAVPRFSHSAVALACISAYVCLYSYTRLSTRTTRTSPLPKCKFGNAYISWLSLCLSFFRVPLLCHEDYIILNASLERRWNSSLDDDWGFIAFFLFREHFYFTSNKCECKLDTPRKTIDCLNGYRGVAAVRVYNFYRYIGHSDELCHATWI